MGSVARVTEISSRSETSFEDAIKTGIQRASQTLRGLRSAWIKEQEVTLDPASGQITGYEVIMKVTFVLEDGQ
jgi:dodecin